MKELLENIALAEKAGWSVPDVKRLSRTGGQATTSTPDEQLERPALRKPR